MAPPPSADSSSNLPVESAKTPVSSSHEAKRPPPLYTRSDSAASQLSDATHERAFSLGVSVSVCVCAAWQFPTPLPLPPRLSFRLPRVQNPFIGWSCPVHAGEQEYLSQRNSSGYPETSRAGEGPAFAGDMSPMYDSGELQQNVQELKARTTRLFEGLSLLPGNSFCLIYCGALVKGGCDPPMNIVGGRGAAEGCATARGWRFLSCKNVVKLCGSPLTT